MLDRTVSLLHVGGHGVALLEGCDELGHRWVSVLSHVLERRSEAALRPIRPNIGAVPHQSVDGGVEFPELEKPRHDVTVGKGAVWKCAPPCSEEACAREQLGVLLAVGKADQSALVLGSVRVVDVGVGR